MNVPVPTSTNSSAASQRKPIKRALVSVYDKTGLEHLARVLQQHEVTIVSTGSTAKQIAQAGVKVQEVSQVTGFPECLDGRVKTLHPRIHAGILADRRIEQHRQQLAELEVEPFDLVVCNLYPFSETIASGAGFQDCIEQIDIGGPSMVRAAAKNHANLAVVVDPASYPLVEEALAQGGFSEQQRRQLAAQAFAHTAQYDAQISSWFAQQLGQTEGELAANSPACLGGQATGVAGAAGAAGTAGATGAGEAETRSAQSELPDLGAWGIGAQLLDQLRYGENPHQSAAVWALPAGPHGLAQAKQLNGKPMSYNNYQDADAAWRAAWEHQRPCVAVIKHANPCGIAVADTIAAAHRQAHACDPLSAYGGVIAANRVVDLEMAQQVRPIFTEVILAPGYQEQALEVLRQKKNLRIMQLADYQPPTAGFDYKQISGGILVQARDLVDQPLDRFENWTLAAGPAADPETAKDLEFAWRAIRAVKSNAILLAKAGATVGIGMGQVNRVDSCHLAVERANSLGINEKQSGEAETGTVGGLNADQNPEVRPPQRSRGSVAASDAFFPFSDGPKVLIDAGVRAIVQPGGSIRDRDTIQLCESSGVSLYLTGIRHFWH